MVASIFSLEPAQQLDQQAAAAAPESLPVPRLEYYAPVNPKPNAGAVIVCPGGGYHGRAGHEGAPVARRFAENGLHAFVLHYRVAPNRHPLPLKDAATAIAFVRKNAESFDIAPDKIAILGFSAGGHLAASASTLFAEAEPLLEPSLQGTSPRPDAQILCYAVINGHTGSFRNLYGPDAGDAEFERFSLNLRVTEDTPPAFFWHTLEDPAVDVDNAYDYARALRKHGVSYELHVFPKGPHGIGLADEAANRHRGAPLDSHIEVRVWPELATTWLKGQGW